MKTAALTSVALLVPRLALACPVCFGVSDGPILQGSSMGILALLIVTLAMLGVFAAFIAVLARRAIRAERTDSGRTTLAAGAHATGDLVR
ncbi:MAG: hypothetical protein QM736_16060 [Vicinamibacterales bacterium]